MKKKEAYDTLGLIETASQEEVKKAFKKLAAKNHPDVNKDPTAEATFKKINEAYQCIEQNKFDDDYPKDFMGGTYSSGYGAGFGINLEDILQGFDFFGKNKYGPPPQDVFLTKNISFKESVLGVKKDITYDHEIACHSCKGNGKISLNNGCKECNGKGKVFKNNGFMFSESTCRSCKGKIDKKDCTGCQGKGALFETKTLSVSIPPGITNKSALRLNGVGNYKIGFGTTSVILTINVEPDHDLKLIGGDVVSNLNISLLEALQGCSKSVYTIDGEKDIQINVQAKHKDEVVLPKLGVGRIGNHRVIVNIDYPKELSKLIDALKE